MDRRYDMKTILLVIVGATLTRVASGVRFYITENGESYPSNRENSWILDTTHVEYASTGELCRSFCKLEGESYMCRNAKGTFENCSPAPGVSSLGRACNSLRDNNNNKWDNCRKQSDRDDDYCCPTLTSNFISSCDSCSPTTSDEFYSIKGSALENVSIPNICTITNRDNHGVVLMEQLEVSTILNGGIHIIGVFSEIGESVDGKISLRHQFQKPSIAALGAAVENIFMTGTAYETKGTGLVYTSNYGKFENLLLKEDDAIIATVRISHSTEVTESANFQRIIKRALHFSLIRGEVVWIVQKCISSGVPDELECPMEIQPAEGHEQVATATNMLKNPPFRSYFIMSPGRLPFETQANPVFIRGDEFPVKFGFPFYFPIECHDSAWNIQKLKEAFKNIRQSNSCLKLHWGMNGHDDEAPQEIWSISSTVNGCTVSRIFQELHNCRYAPSNTNPKLFEMDKMISIKLNETPNVNTTVDIAKFWENYWATLEFLTPDGVKPPFVDPKIEIHFQGKSPLKIQFEYTWDEPTVRSLGQYYDLKSRVNNLSTFIFIIPCLLETNHDWIARMREAILETGDDIAVVTLEWPDSWNFWMWEYPKAVATSQDIGEGLGKMVRLFKHDFKHAFFWGVGSGLGAHLLGRAGRDSGVFHRITGLDPSGPAFDSIYQEHRLTHKDAKFVDVIHSDWNQTYQLVLDHVEETENLVQNCWNNDVEHRSNPFGHYGISLPSGSVDFYLSPKFDWKPSDPFGMDAHLKAIELFILSISRPPVFETDVEIVSNNEPALPKTCQRGRRVAEMGFHANPATRGVFFVNSVSAQDPVRWTSRPLYSLPSVSEVDCRDVRNPRVTSIAVGNGTYKKIEVYRNVEDKVWENLYGIYFNVFNLTSVVSIHNVRVLKPSVGGADNSNKSGSKEQHPIVSRVCSYGLPGRTSDMAEGSSNDSEVMPDFFNGKVHATRATDQSGEEKESFDSLPEELWKNHVKAVPLVPSSDFLGPNLENATNLYINSAPQLEILYLSIWKKLEEFIQGLARIVPLKVFTFSLNSDISHTSELINAVPGDLIKVVLMESTGCAYTFIVDNNPIQAKKFYYSYDVCPAGLKNLINLPREDKRMRRLHCFNKVTENVLGTLKSVDHKLYRSILSAKDDCNFW